MRFSFAWMGEYVDTGSDPGAAGARLTEVGIPLDSLEPFDNDTSLHFDVPTNRPDCMNHLGLARELAAAGRRPLRPPAGELPPASPAAGGASVEVEAPDLCGRYTAILIRGVRVGDSPGWLSRRLRSIGQRPINAVVDATNFVLWELGHPLHAFDLARLGGNQIRVRRARSGERLTTLDGLDRKLEPEMLVIADNRRPVALAGVMGGRDSEISASTTDILLESAHFDPISIRRTSRRLGLHTDASHRFERGADPEVTLGAAARCASLIVEVSGGRIGAGAFDIRAASPVHREIPLRPNRVQLLLGLDIPVDEMRGILQRLGCRVEAGESHRWRVFPPSFRQDLAREEDLVEEVARHHGYDEIPTTLPRLFLPPEGRSERDRRLTRIREEVVRAGYSEAMTLSLVSAEDNGAFGGPPGGGLRILNPLAEGQDRMRGNLVSGLLGSVAHNLNHGASEVRLFETGRVFRPRSLRSELPEEDESLALVVAGREGRHWSEAGRPPDLFDLKGALDRVIRRVGLPAAEWRPASRPFLVDGESAAIFVDRAEVGFAGRLAPATLARWEIEVPVCGAEISLETVLASRSAATVPRYAPLARTPSVRRDLALVLGEDHPYAEMEATIRGVEGAPVVAVIPFDRYQGQPIPAGKVSLAITLVFQDPERTLRSSEVAESLERIVQRLRDRLGAELRGN